MSKDLKLPADYGSLLVDIKERIHAAQYRALRAVNRELVGLYWGIGELITERQRAEGWGKSVVQRLALDLQTEFPGMRGFSASNLWRMRGLVEAYGANEKLAPLVREIGWSHNLVIMARYKDPQQRGLYQSRVGCDEPA